LEQRIKGKANSGSFKNGNKLWDNENNKKTRFKGGKDCPSWKGGISYEPYTEHWTKNLKKSIRRRDNYTCSICGVEPAICVHHIDYNKKNCNPDNLITLCDSCHSKTNHRREYWLYYFKRSVGMNINQMQ
jgi:hypothetical protein